MESLSTAGRNVKWHWPYEKQYGVYKKLNRVPYDPAFSLLNIYLKKMKSLSDICTLMFIEVLFIKVKIRKQPKFLLINECIKENVICTYNGILLSL